MLLSFGTDMKSFFDKVAGRLGKLDQAGVSRQYRILAREAGFLEDVLGALEEGVIAIGPDGTLLYANAAAGSLLGFSPEKMRGKAWSVAEGGQMREYSPLSVASSVRVREFEIAYPEKRIVEMRTITRGPDGAVVIVRDVTALRAREAEAIDEGRTEAVRELASGIAHEIGNPLNALSLNLQLFARSLSGVEDEALRKSLLADAESMRGEIARLDGIVKKFLQALRPVRPELAPGSVAGPLGEMLVTMRPLFETHRVKATLDLPPALPPVMLDSAQMAQVFFNLAKNALEAMKDGGELEITVAPDDDNVNISFRDTGIGMDGAALGRIFASGRTTKSTGSGLGLMLSQRIVRAHGGVIDVASQKGKGSVFTVRLPRLNRRIRELD